jgi:hypothetical protein
MYGYGNSGNIWGTFFVIIIVTIIVFLICRELVCWYWKINKLVTLIEEQNKLLTLLVKGEKIDIPIENAPSKLSGKAYTVIIPTKIFYERDNNSNVMKDLDVGDQVSFQYDCKEGEILWYFVKESHVEGWCKAEYLKEC